MSDRLSNISTNVFRFIYWIGRLSGVVVFTYDKRLGQVELSKILRVIFPALKSMCVLIQVVHVVLTFYYYENLISTMMFAAQSFTFFTFSILIVISQTTHSKKYIDIINDTIKLFKILKIKVRNESFFDGTFFFLFFVKTITNAYVVFGNFGIFINPEVKLTFRLAIINMTILHLTNVIFLNFAFIGLLLASAFQNNLYNYLRRCSKIKDLEEFSIINAQFKQIFKRFNQLTEIHFLSAILFYLVSISAGLTFIIMEADQYKNKLSTFGFQICCIIDLLNFNMAADLVEKTSTKIDFFKVDLLCNDSLEVISLQSKYLMIRKFFQMDLVLTQIKSNKSEIFVLGLMKLGNNLSLKILAGIVTYTVYLMQLKIIEEQKVSLAS